MELTKSPLIDEIRAILNRKEPFIFHHYRVEFFQGDKIVKPLTITSIDTIRDYVNGFGDEIVLEVAIGAGTYEHELYPLRKDLMARLYKEPLCQEDPSKPETQTQMQLFRAIMPDDKSQVLEGNSRFMASQHAGDLSDIKYVKFQLVDQALELIRMMSVGTLLKDTTTAEALRYMLTKVSKDLPVDEQNKVLGVDMIEPSNKEPQKHVLIPHGLPFTDLPEWIEQKCSAIYNAGLGVYLQNHTWYVYPTHDTSRYDKALKTLTVVNVPPDRYGQIEKTWRETPNQLIVLASGQTQHFDTSERNELQDGNGVRFLDARKVLEGFSETIANRTQALRADNNHEFVSGERVSGLNNVISAAAKITSNIFLEASKLAKRKGAYVRCVWEHSDPSKIYPGMPVKFLYTVREKAYEAKGTVQHVHSFVSAHEAGLSNKRHNSQSILLLHLESLVEWQDDPEVY